MDTTATFARGVASLRAHQAYIDGLGWANFDPEEFLEGGARQAGTRLGVPMATTFEVFDLGWGAGSRCANATAWRRRAPSAVAPPLVAQRL